MSHDPQDRLAAAVEAAERWAIHDPDPSTRGRIDALVRAGSPELVEMFEGRLGFGTSGLRAAVGPGPCRMGALVIRQTTAAVLAWVRDRRAAASPVPEGPERILVGFDGRRDSRRFADHAAAAIHAGGGQALRADEAAPTPVFVHAALAAGADAAIVITASHNPAGDNGYKLYLDDGMAPVSPTDTEIASRIDDLAERWHDVGPAVDDAFADQPPPEPGTTQDWTRAHRQDLLARTRDLAVEPVLRLGYTAMHGVGGPAMVAALTQAGFAAPVVVVEQFEPDPEFPTVEFPNPEEPGALDALIELMADQGCDAGLANDPDGDRLALVVEARDGQGFSALSGDQLGVLLGDFALRSGSGERVVARTVVSSRLLDRVAAAHGVATAVTLTGFKWLARSRRDHPGATWVFGYEEAIGYGFGDTVRDKDGIAAGVMTAHMLSDLVGTGRTVWDRLDDLAVAHGLYETTQVGLRFDDEPARPAEIVAALLASPPERLADEALARSGPIGFGELPPTSGLHLLGESGTQVIVRPSGTEPKIKAYIEVCVPPPDPAQDQGWPRAAWLADAHAAALDKLESTAAWVRSLLS